MRFAYLLARTFHRIDIDEFLEETGEERFENWFEAYQIDPWGPERDDWRMRMFAAISGVPGQVQRMEYPSSFEAVKRLKSLDPIGDEQDSLDVVVGTLNALTERLNKRGK